MHRCALVTGAASGIGRGIALRLVENGWTVVGFDIAPLPADDDAGRALAAAERFTMIGCDLADPASVAAAFEQAARRVARINALICSAGVLRVGPLATMRTEDVDALLAVNVRGPWLCVREALPLLRAAAAQAGQARVVLLGSVSGLRPKTGSGMYAASKAAVHVLTGVLAVELAAEKILVNAIAPGTIDTPMIRAGARGNSSFKLSGTSPLGRIGSPGDIASLVEFLLDDKSSYITGVTIPVDGGTRAAFVGS